MKPKLLLLLVPACLSACSKTGDEFICWDEAEEVDLSATARHSWFSGELISYEAVDANGLQVSIDAANSANYACEPRAELQRAAAEAKAEFKRFCDGIKQSGIVADADLHTMIEAERCKLEAKEAD